MSENSNTQPIKYNKVNKYTDLYIGEHEVAAQ